MSKVDIEYHKLCTKILKEGYTYTDKSRDITCLQISSYNLELDKIHSNFPLLTTKKMFTKGIVGELLWFLRGEDNIKYLNKNNIHIWDKDAKNFSTEGYVGRNYGVQWRNWTGKNYDSFDSSLYTRVDQIQNLIQNLINKPISRRHIVTAWNPAELDETALPPCHWAFEIIPYPIGFFERIQLSKESEKLSNIELNEEGIYIINEELTKEGVPLYQFDLKWHQRSVDTFLGLPFNITSYALLMKIIGELTGYIPNKLIGDLSNVHFYEPHIKLVKEQLINDTQKYSSPEFQFSEKALREFERFRRGTIDLDAVLCAIDIEDFNFRNYNFFPAIGAEMYEPKK